MNIKIINPITYVEDKKNDKDSDILIALNTSKDFQQGLINLVNIPTNPQIIYIPTPSMFFNTDFSIYDQSIEKTINKIDNVNYLNNSTFLYTDKKIKYRFIGSLLWNDFNNLNEELVSIALIKSLLFSKIKAKSWFDDSNNHNEFNKLNDTLCQNNNYYNIYKQFYKKGYFHPIISYLLYKESNSFLINELKKPFDGKTILLAHNQPTDYGIYFSGIQTSLKDNKVSKFFNKKQKIETYLSRKANIEPILKKYNIDYVFNGHSLSDINYKFYNSNVFSCHNSDISINLNSDINTQTIIYTIEEIMKEHNNFINGIKDNMHLITNTSDFIEIINLYNFLYDLLPPEFWTNILSKFNVLFKVISIETIGITLTEVKTNNLNSQRLKILLSFITQNYYSLQLLVKNINTID